MEGPHQSYVTSPATRELIVRLREIRPFYDVLNKYFRESGLSQADVARKLHLDPSAINHYLKGERMPNGESVAELGTVLGCTESQLGYLAACWAVQRLVESMPPYIEKADKNGFHVVPWSTMMIRLVIGLLDKVRNGDWQQPE